MSDCIMQLAAMKGSSLTNKNKNKKPCALLTKADLWEQLSKSLIAV